MTTLFHHLLSTRFLRFAMVGGLTGLVYALVVFTLQSLSPMPPSVSSVIGYLIAIPVNFLGQKFFAFRSAARMSGEITPYLAVQAVNVALSWGVMKLAVEALELFYLWGAALVILSVPVVTYFSLKLFVFVSAMNTTKT